MRLFTFFLLLFPVLSLAQSRYVLHCGAIFDAENARLLNEYTVVVEGNEIVKVSAGYLPVQPGDSLLNLQTYTLMPGLMDMHVHLEGETSPTAYTEKFVLNEADVAFRAARHAYTTLMAGFTTVRDLGGSGVNISLRKAIDGGWIDGPRVFTAGKSIATTGGHADPTNGYRQSLMGSPGPAEGVINGPDEASQAVRQAYKNGSDVIKITATGGVLSVAKDGSGPQFSSDELAALVATANDYGFTVAAHAHGPEGMKRAILAGVTSIEHGTLMTPELMQLMKQRGTYYVPTLTAGRTVADSAKIPHYYPDVVTPKALAIGPRLQATFGEAVKAGVLIAFGTDAGVFKHGLNAKEFSLMVEGGMSPAQAIQSATYTAASLLRQEQQLGQIKEGFLADLVAVKGNPIENIALLESLDLVMKDGRLYKFN